LQISFKKR